MHIYNTTVRLHHTDAAGVLFFAQLFTLAHDCYEDFLNPVLPINTILSSQPYALPIVHADADFYAPISVSDSLTIAMSCTKLSERSFTFEYQFSTLDHSKAAKVTTVHTAIDKESKKTIRLDSQLITLLESLSS